jgi:hypothetical protein
MVGRYESTTEAKASLIETVRAVAASFFGVRGSRAHERDMSRLNPLAVIAVGIALAVLFVLGLLTVVKLVVGS